MRASGCPSTHHSLSKAKCSLRLAQLPVRARCAVPLSCVPLPLAALGLGIFGDICSHHAHPGLYHSSSTDVLFDLVRIAWMAGWHWLLCRSTNGLDSPVASYSLIRCQVHRAVKVCSIQYYALLSLVSSARRLHSPTSAPKAVSIAPIQVYPSLLQGHSVALELTCSDYREAIQEILHRVRPLLAHARHVRRRRRLQITPVQGGRADQIGRRQP
jgi:hypothetical protein